MAITFSLTLSHNQILILKAIEVDTDTPRGPEQASAHAHQRHFVTGIRTLMNERLVDQVEETTDLRGRPFKWKRFVITEKGRLVCRLVEMELTESASLAELLSSQRSTAEATHWREIDKLKEATAIRVIDKEKPVPEEREPFLG